MFEKRAVIAIVEGASDMATIGPMMKEYFTSADTRFVINRGVNFCS